jgi:gas vesicle protein
MTEETRSIGIGTIIFVAGFVAGVGTGLLFASKSAVRTRRQILDLAKDMQEEADRMSGGAKMSIGKVIQQRSGESTRIATPMVRQTERT